MRTLINPNTAKKTIYLLLLLAMGCKTGSTSYIVPNDAPTAVIDSTALQYQKLLALYQQEPANWPAPTIDSTINWTELGLLPKPNYNGETPSKAMLLLGKQLFFDHRISQTRQFACASCHHPDQNFTDNRRVSLGFELKQGTRNAPTVLNLSYNKNFFWDGRATSLEAQALQPMTNPVEMNTSLDTVLARVRGIAGYRQSFKEITQKDSISISDIAYAIASYERSLISRRSSFDYFLLGRKTLSPAEINGLHLFRTKGRCMNCHHGPNFTDNDFHNLGLTYYGRKYYEDLGRYNHTKKAADVGKFKTPSLRDVMRTRPWMHNGLFDDMDGILNMYNAGMPVPRRKPEQEQDSLFPTKSPLLHKLNLTKKERDDIVAFLYAISEPSFKIRKPALPQ